MMAAMILVYRFLIPSIWTFRGKQLYGFESELLDEVKGLREEMGKLSAVVTSQQNVKKGDKE